MVKKDKFTIKLKDIPVGYWDLNGNWFPNLRLKMTVNEQIRHNIRGGHYSKPISRDYLLIVCVEDEKQSLISRIKKRIMSVFND